MNLPKHQYIATDNPIRIGILGAAKIAPSAVIKPAANSGNAVVQAVCARSPDKASIFARKHGIPHAAHDYAALIARDDIDLIYNPLPPSAHAQWTIAALQAGKHVLCEKPFCMNASEARDMVDAAKANDRHLIEAFHYRFHPLMDSVMDMLPEIGPVRHIEAEFSVPIPNRKSEFRYHRDLGGGALMDLGVYPIHFCRSITGEEPQVTKAKPTFHANGVDLGMSLQIEFPSGVTADLKFSMKTWRRPRAYAVITGEKGALRVTNFVAPHLYNKITLKTQERSWSGKVKGRSTYDHQLEHVLAVLRGKAAPITGGADAIATMQVIDSVNALAERS